MLRFSEGRARAPASSFSKLHGPRGVHRLLALPAALALALWGAPASATGSFACEAGEGAVKFEAQGVYSYGLGGAFSNFHGILMVPVPEAPSAEIPLDGDALAHHWFSRGDLKLHVFWEQSEGPVGSVELWLDVKARRKDDTGYRGSYELKVTPSGEGGKVRTFRGGAKCSVG